MSQTELKDVILDLFDQVREANARNAVKDRMIAIQKEKLDAVLRTRSGRGSTSNPGSPRNGDGTRNATVC